jgi:hypothetical protein
MMAKASNLDFMSALPDETIKLILTSPPYNIGKSYEVGVSVVPVASLARRIDENVAYFERARKELPSARLSITLPILLIGLEDDQDTPVIDLTATQFGVVSKITGKGNADNRWRIVNGIIAGHPPADMGESSDTGPTTDEPDTADLDAETPA